MYRSLATRLMAQSGSPLSASLTKEQINAITASLVDVDESSSTGTAIRVQAGPGSGKTRVIVHRIEHLLQHISVDAVNILALTFTRKAADEMRDRLINCLDVSVSRDITVTTLHGFCVRILRRFAEIRGFRGSNSFSIYDDDDSRRVLKGLLQQMVDQGYIKHDDMIRFQVAKVHERLSQVKRSYLFHENQIIGENSCRLLGAIDEENEGEDYPIQLTKLARELLPSYEAALASRNAFDFDDLIIKTLYLLKICKEKNSVDLIDKIKKHFGGIYAEKGGRGHDENLAGDLWDLALSIRGRYRHVLVDEWQDIDATQYALIRELCEGVGGQSSTDREASFARSLFVVGDADQTIYSWRGADPRTMDDFPNDYPRCLTYNLTTNFRSHEDIVAGAEAVISKSIRRGSSNSVALPSAPAMRAAIERDNNNCINGEKVVQVINSYNDAAQARFIAEMIRYQLDGGHFEPQEIAILYRKHSQVLPIEAALLDSGVPYSLKGGPSFMERKSTKDAMAYLRLLINPQDEVALKRIINYPRRGLGPKAQSMLFDKMSADISRFRGSKVRWWYLDKEVELSHDEGALSSSSIHEVIVTFAKKHFENTASGKKSRGAIILHDEQASHSRNGVGTTSDGDDDVGDSSVGDQFSRVEYRLTPKMASALMDLGLLLISLRESLQSGSTAIAAVANNDDECHGNKYEASHPGVSLREWVSASLTEIGMIDISAETDQASLRELPAQEFEEKRKAAAYQVELKQLIALVGLHEQRYNEERTRDLGGDRAEEDVDKEVSLLPKLTSFLDGALLDQDLESQLTSDGHTLEEETSKEKIQLMSLHASKGLEFGCVLLVGAEEGTLPSVPGGSIFKKKKKKNKTTKTNGGKGSPGEEEGDCAGDGEGVATESGNGVNSAEEREIEEERRLFYVGMTRAKSKLMVLYRSRVTMATASGRKAVNIPVEPSRFLRDLPQNVPFLRFDSY